MKGKKAFLRLAENLKALLTYSFKWSNESKELKMLNLLIVSILVLLPFLSIQPLIPQAYAQDFMVKELRYFPKAQRSILLNNGTVVSYFEESRPPTEEEKSKRASYFDKEWEELERKSMESIPKMEKTIEEGTQEAEKEIQKKPFLMPLSPFFSIVSKFFSEVANIGLQIAKTEGKRYFVNQPVVTKAGFLLEYPEGRKEEILFDLEEEYGPEEWMRIPNDAVNIQASFSGRFLGLETEKAGILLFEYDHMVGRFLRLGRVEGRHPFGFSIDDRYMFVTLEKGLYRIDILPPPDWREKTFFISPHRPFKEVKINIEKGSPVYDIILKDDYLFLLTWTKLYVYDVINERIQKEFKFGGYGGRSMILGPLGDIFVAGMDMSSVVKINTKDWSVYELVKENNFDLPRKHGVYFHKLVSISPDEKYVAALYDPGLIPPPNAKNWSGSTTGESRLFIWAVKEKKVAYRFNETLEDISGGFGYQSPACITPNWEYVLLTLKKSGNKLLQLRRF